MFNANTNCERLCFKRLWVGGGKQPVDVNRGVARCKQHRVSGELMKFFRVRVFRANTRHRSLCFSWLRRNERRALCVKVELAAELDYLLAHCIYNRRKLVRSNVWMCVSENRFVRTKVDEQLQNAVNVAALVAPRVELAVAERTGTAFAKAVVAVFAHHALCADSRNVAFAGARFRTPLNDDRLHPLLKQLECAEQTRRSCTNDDDPVCSSASGRPRSSVSGRRRSCARSSTLL